MGAVIVLVCLVFVNDLSIGHAMHDLTIDEPTFIIVQTILCTIISVCVINGITATIKKAMESK